LSGALEVLRLSGALLSVALEVLSSSYNFWLFHNFFTTSQFTIFNTTKIKLEHDEDVFYLEDEREPDEECCARAVAFLEWLNRRPEKCIAVVTHSSFLRHLFGQFGGSLASDDQDSLQRLAGNCELRSVVLCSHGNKDSKQPDKMKANFPTLVKKQSFGKSKLRNPSTVVMSSGVEGEFEGDCENTE